MTFHCIQNKQLLFWKWKHEDKTIYRVYPTCLDGMIHSRLSFESNDEFKHNFLLLDVFYISSLSDFILQVRRQAVSVTITPE